MAYDYSVVVFIDSTFKVLWMSIIRLSYKNIFSQKYNNVKAKK